MLLETRFPGVTCSMVTQDLALPATSSRLRSVSRFKALIEIFIVDDDRGGTEILRLIVGGHRIDFGRIKL